MTIRPEVQVLVDFGPFPASADAEVVDVERLGALLTRIAPPVTGEEAMTLLSCFGPDEAFGLAWTLLHLIEMEAIVRKRRTAIVASAGAGRA